MYINKIGYLILSHLIRSMKIENIKNSQTNHVRSSRTANNQKE